MWLIQRNDVTFPSCFPVSSPRSLRPAHTCTCRNGDCLGARATPTELEPSRWRSSVVVHVHTSWSGLLLPCVIDAGVQSCVFTLFQTRSVIRSAMRFWTPTSSRILMPKLRVVSSVLSLLCVLAHLRCLHVGVCLVLMLSHIFLFWQRPLPRLGWSFWLVRWHLVPM